MKIRNCDKFHQYNICGCQVNSFQSFEYGFSIHEMVFFGWILRSYSLSSILPKFSLDIEANKKIVSKFSEGFDFLWKRDEHKVCIFSPILTPHFPMKKAKIENKILFLLTKFSYWAIQICQNQGSIHCVKNVRIRSYSSPHFPAFGLNTERHFVLSPNAGKCGPE